MQDQKPLNRLPLFLALLFLVFFVSTSSGFANLSAIQEQLRDMQVRLIKEKVKLAEEEISKLRVQMAPLPPPFVPVEEKVMSRVELETALKRQIQSLDTIVNSLRPKAIEEETVRLETLFKKINKELETAEGDRLYELQEELARAADDYAGLQSEVRRSLEDTLKSQQVQLIREQIKVLQGKVESLPREAPKRAVVGEPRTIEEDQAQQVKMLQSDVEKVRLKLLQTQVKVIQEKINALRK